jgi:hypothetical protein
MGAAGEVLGALGWAAVARAAAGAAAVGRGEETAVVVVGTGAAGT